MTIAQLQFMILQMDQQLAQLAGALAHHETVPQYRRDHATVSELLEAQRHLGAAQSRLSILLEKAIEDSTPCET